MEGEGSSVGHYIAAALAFCRPELKKVILPRVLTALKGWDRLCPPGSRLPLPRGAVALICNGIIRRGHRRIAIGAWMSMEGYLRPGEGVGAWVSDLCPPIHGAGPGASHWSLLLHPIERATPSKTGSYDDTVLFDMPYHQPVVGAFSWVKSVSQPTDLIFTCSQGFYENLWKECGEAVGVKCLSPVPYQLRHTGPSHDRATNSRTQSEVQKRVRWLTATSVRRYEKGGRMRNAES